MLLIAATRSYITLLLLSYYRRFVNYHIITHYTKLSVEYPERNPFLTSCCVLLLLLLLLCVRYIILKNKYLDEYRIGENDVCICTHREIFVVWSICSCIFIYVFMCIVLYIIYTYIHIHYSPRLYHVTHTFFPVEVRFEFVSLKVFLLMSLLYLGLGWRISDDGNPAVE